MPTAGGLGSQVRRGVAWGLLNNLVLRFGNVAVGIVLARLLVPADFGVYAVALTVQSILVTFSELGMTADLVRHGDIRRRGPTAVTLGLLVSSSLALFMCLVAEPMASALGSVQATDEIRVLAVTLVLSSFTAVPAAVLQRAFRQGSLFTADLFSFGVTTVSTLVMIQAGWGAMSLAASRVVGQVVAVALLVALSRTLPRPGYDRGIARQLWRFGLPLASANFLSWALLNIDYMVVGHNLGATMLGFYVLAFNVSSWPMNALAQALRAVSLPAFARLEQDPTNVAPPERELARAVGLTWAAAAPMSVLLSVLATPVVVTLYGGLWSASAAALAALGALGAVRAVFDLLATYLTATGATRAVLVVQVVWGLTLVPAMVLGTRMGGLAGAGWAHVAVAVLVVGPAYAAALRRHGIRTGVVLSAIRAPTLGAVACGLAAAGVAWLVGDPAWLVLLSGGLAGALAYAVVVGRWFARELGVARPILRRTRRRTSTLSPAGGAVAVAGQPSTTSEAPRDH